MVWKVFYQNGLYLGNSFYKAITSLLSLQMDILISPRVITEDISYCRVGHLMGSINPWRTSFPQSSLRSHVHLRAILFTSFVRNLNTGTNSFQSEGTSLQLQLAKIKASLGKYSYLNGSYFYIFQDYPWPLQASSGTPLHEVTNEVWHLKSKHYSINEFQ